MFETRRMLTFLAAGSLALGLAACGGGGDPIVVATPTPPPTPPPPKTVAQGGQALEVGYAYGFYFNIDATGTLDVTVDYTFPDSLMLVWLAKGRCTPEQFEAEQCTYLTTSFTGGKPRKFSVSSQPAGTYTLIVGNLGPKGESFSYAVVFAQSSAGGTVGASVRGVSGPGFLAPLPAHVPRP
jgi:hypothetical protein